METHNEHTLPLTIDGKKYSWHKQYIKGAEVKKLGNISSEFEVFLKVDKTWDDELVKDEGEIDLARPGIEHFYSKEKHHEVIIIVDGSPHKWNKKEITFEEVIILAFGNYIDKPTMVYTVAYEDGPKENPYGSMIKGSVVLIKNKMIFHATQSDKS